MLSLDLVFKKKEFIYNRMKSLENGCVEYPILNADEYGDVQFIINNKKYHLLAHRAVYMIENNILLTSEQIVMHSCDNPACINIKHLSVGTHADNQADKINKGRQILSSGKANGRYKHGYYAKLDHVERPKTPFEELHGRKLTLEEVKLIKLEIFSKTKTLKEVSKQFNVKETLIRDISSGRTYKNI